MGLQAADIVNQGLRAGGVPLRIGDLYEGSEQAKTALEIYGEARDALLRVTDWSFQRTVAALTLLKGPPPNGGYLPPITPWTNIYPLPGFLYEYAYPGDAVDIWAVIQQPSQMPDSDPLPGLFRVDNDPTPVVSGMPPAASGPPAKVVLTNITNALAVYPRRVTDPAQWHPGFVAALVSDLGKKFAKAFGADANEVKEDAAEAVATGGAMANVRG
jgi:hypothetical protein